MGRKSSGKLWSVYLYTVQRKFLERETFPLHNIHNELDLQRYSNCYSFVPKSLRVTWRLQNGSYFREKYFPFFSNGFKMVVKR